MIEMLQETTRSDSHYVSKFKNRGGQKQLSRKKKTGAFRQQVSHSKGQDLPQDSDLNPETQSNLR